MTTLWNVPKNELTPERLMSGVKQNGWNLAYASEYMQTPELIQAALNQTEWAIVFIKNTEMRRDFIQKHGKFSREVEKDLRQNNLL